MLSTKDELPHYVERLESLKSVHNECSKVFTKLRDLEQTQSGLIETLKGDKESLLAIKKGLQENMEIARANFAALTARLKK